MIFYLITELIVNCIKGRTAQMTGPVIFFIAPPRQNKDIFRTETKMKFCIKD